MRSTFSVIFYLKKEKLKKDGTNPIMGRITVDGTMAQFSCKQSCDPAIWEAKGGHAKGKTIAARDINRELDKIKASIVKHYQEIMIRDGYVTAEKVKNSFLGLEYRKQTLMSIFEQWNIEYAKQVEGGLKAKKTYERYKAVYKHVGDFLQSHYHVSDIALKEITVNFLSDFEIFLKTEKHLAHNTVETYVKPVMMLLHRAQENGWVARYPFGDYHIQREEREKGFLTKDELQAVMNLPIKNAKRSYIRDLFVFCCFTGLAYIDLKNLQEENLVKNPVDGSLWIRTRRQKTGVTETVKLLPVALGILNKYRGLGEDGRVFVVPYYKSVFEMLKTIAKHAGIKKNVTWHMARHTMATVICLSNGMPLEVVSSLLGHKNIKSTQIYAKITQEKLGCEIDTLASKLAKIEQFVPNIDLVVK